MKNQFIQILLSFFIYDAIQTSCFSVRSSKELADQFRRPSVLIESVENVNIQQVGYTPRVLVRFKTLGYLDQKFVQSYDELTKQEIENTMIVIKIVLTVTTGGRRDLQRIHSSAIKLKRFTCASLSGRDLEPTEDAFSVRL